MCGRCEVNKIKQVRWCPPNASFSMAGMVFTLYEENQKYFYCVDANGAPYNRTEIKDIEAFDDYVKGQCQ